MKTLYALIGIMAMSTMAFAQPRPPGGPEGGPPPPGDRERDRGGDRPEARPDRPLPGGGGGGGFGGGQMDPRMMKLELMRGYLDSVDRYAKLSRDSVTTGIAAVVAANDTLRPRGADAAIEFFNKMLGEAKNEAVQHTIRLQLVELYKMAGQQDKALEQLQSLIVAAPAGAEPTPPGPPPPGAEKR